MSRDSLDEATAAAPVVEWIWSGRLEDGSTLGGRDEAATRAVLQTRLGNRGVFVDVLDEDVPRRSHLGADATGEAITQLAKLIAARIAIVDALDVIASGHAGSPLGQAFERIRDNVRNGRSLAESFTMAGVLDGGMAELIRVGESTGNLAGVLEQIVSAQTNARRQRKSLQKALAYPVTVFVIALVVTIVMLTQVVPQFAEIYHQFGADLPVVTQWVLNGGEFLNQYGAIGFLLGLVLATGAYLVRNSLWARSVRWTPRLAILPGIAKLHAAEVTATGMRTLAMALDAGMPLVSALELARTTGRDPIRASLTVCIDRLSDGSSLTQAVESIDQFPAIVKTMIAAGEAAGDLATMLRHIAEHYDEQRDRTTSILTAMAEPLVMVMLGGLVGGILIALYLPIFGLGHVLGGA